MTGAFSWGMREKLFGKEGDCYMGREKERKVYVVGHKNPDTDSICSAIVYAAFKTKITGQVHEPRLSVLTP